MKGNNSTLFSRCANAIGPFSGVFCRNALAQTDSFSYRLPFGGMLSLGPVMFQLKDTLFLGPTVAYDESSAEGPRVFLGGARLETYLPALSKGWFSTSAAISLVAGKAGLNTGAAAAGQLSVELNGCLQILPGLTLVGYPAVLGVYLTFSLAWPFIKTWAGIFGLMMSFNLVDLLVIDWLVFCLITPRFIQLLGTEGHPGYKNYTYHFKAFLKGCLFSVLGSLLLAGVIQGIKVILEN